MFGKRKTDSGTSAPAAVAAYEAALPDTALTQARKLFMDSMGDAHVSASRSFWCAMVFGVLALVEAFALKGMLPLKQTIPYVIKVEEKAGDTHTDRAAAIPAAQYDPAVTVIDRDLLNFVKALYAMNAEAVPLILQQQQMEGLAFTRDRATAEFKEFVNKEQVYQRMAKTPGLVRTVEKKTLSHRPDAPVVLIRYSTIERTKAAPEGIVRNWVMAVTYARTQPSDKDEIDRNPLGIYVTNFDIQEEN
jgi:type IV secretion system protein VirB8